MTSSPPSYLVGLIGAGIGSSLSPALHEQEAEQHGLRLVYRTLDLDTLGLGADDVGELVRTVGKLGYDGLNITYPGKQTVIPHLDSLSEDARALGAVNTVVFDADGSSRGYNTDWSGFAESFARGMRDAPTRRVVQLGAGGAGAAVAHAMLTLGTGRLTVIDAEPGRASSLAAGLAARFGTDRAGAVSWNEAAPLLAAADGLVHATPTGMAHHPGLPLAAELLHPGLWVADVVYRPLDTELLRLARALGCRTLDGGGMAVHQAAHAFRLFTGTEPDPDRMLAHLATLVA
ncbi:shikimate dehydrogenase [Streptomyces sp. NBC_00102]|uniref:shikimate dehydrogenase n=1 Tax=Streptomyces sp. NBC_00102 TaxID=2975652 RepID=UPI00225BF579|nr:shikimate dehydrogenase [Streptomyces sp. NBC_00102]MCX5395513.1 shikimate dehydrogenase [Streptomyces sp. NBC_00102]